MEYLFPNIKPLCLQNYFWFVTIFSSERSIQPPQSLKSWLGGLLMKQSSFLLLTKLKLHHKKKEKWIQSKRLEKRHLICNHRLRLRNEFLLTHCWGEMFDLQHYVQSGDWSSLCFSWREKQNQWWKCFTWFIFWGSIEVQQFFQIIMNNLTSWIAHLLQPIIGV